MTFDFEKKLCLKQNTEWLRISIEYLSTGRQLRKLDGVKTATEF